MFAIYRRFCAAINRGLGAGRSGIGARGRKRQRQSPTCARPLARSVRPKAEWDAGGRRRQHAPKVAAHDGNVLHGDLTRSGRGSAARPIGGPPRGGRGAGGGGRRGELAGRPQIAVHVGRTSRSLRWSVRVAHEASRMRATRRRAPWRSLTYPAAAGALVE